VRVSRVACGFEFRDGNGPLCGRGFPESDDLAWMTRPHFVLR
jgi:hypothetical protein